MTVDFELVAESIPQIVWMAAPALLMLVVPIAMVGRRWGWGQGKVPHAGPLARLRQICVHRQSERRT